MKFPLNNYVITQRFGEHPENYDTFGCIGHMGLDLWSINRSVYACHDGVVVDVTKPNSAVAGGYGICPRIVSEEKVNGVYLYTLYGHLKECYVKIGDKVKEGEFIGIEGNTGNVIASPNGDGTHVHLGLYLLDDVKPNTFQIGFPIGKTYTLLNHNNGYNGAVDPLPYLNNTTMEYIIIGNDQYLLYPPYKIAISIGDPTELAKLNLRGLSGTPAPKTLDYIKGYWEISGVEKFRIKELLNI